MSSALAPSVTALAYAVEVGGDGAEEAGIDVHREQGDRKHDAHGEVRIPLLSGASHEGPILA